MSWDPDIMLQHVSVHCVENTVEQALCKRQNLQALWDTALPQLTKLFSGGELSSSWGDRHHGILERGEAQSMQRGSWLKSILGTDPLLQSVLSFPNFKCWNRETIQSNEWVNTNLWTWRSLQTCSLYLCTQTTDFTGRKRWGYRITFTILYTTSICNKNI